MQFGDTEGDRGVVRADHDPLGVQEVPDGGTLPQELRVRHDVHVVAPQRRADHAGRADRDGRLVDHDRSRGQVGSDRTGGGLDVGQVGRAVGRLWCRHAQQHELPVDHATDHVGGERQPTGGTPLGDDLGQAVLADRHDAVLESGDLRRVVVDAGHVVSEVRETRPRRQADVAGADDRDPVAHTGLPWVTPGRVVRSERTCASPVAGGASYRLNGRWRTSRGRSARRRARWS